MRDSAAQLWVSERESCGWGIVLMASMAWRVDGVTRARQWRGTSCEHAIAAARGGTRVGRGRACGLWVGPRRDARAGVLPVKTPSRTSLSLLPQPPSSSATDAPQPIVCCCVPAGCCFGSARLRGRGFSLRDGCPLMSAACYSPRLLLRGLVGGWRQDAQGAAQPAGGQNTQTISAAALPWEELFCSCVGAFERAVGRMRPSVSTNTSTVSIDVKSLVSSQIATQDEIKRFWVAIDLCARPGFSTSSCRCENEA